jgi:CRISPR-associated protein Cas1
MFKVYETINFKMEGNTLLREKQYTNENRDAIGKKIIINKIENQGHILKALRIKETKEDINILQQYIDKLNIMDGNNYEIMGIEGIASKVYFNRIFKDFNWKGRQPRVKRDEINLLLDIGYTVLFNYIEAILNIYGFDIYKGNLHREFYKRKSLACDMIEPFRPLIDYQVRKVYMLKQVDKWHFTNDNGKYQIDFKDSAEFVGIILRIILEYKESMFEYIQQFYRWFMKEKNLEYFPKARLIKNDID